MTEENEFLKGIMVSPKVRRPTQFFSVLRMHRQDILIAFEGRDDRPEPAYVEAIPDDDLRYIARKVGDDMMASGAWDEAVRQRFKQFMEDSHAIDEGRMGEGDEDCS